MTIWQNIRRYSSITAFIAAALAFIALLLWGFWLMIDQPLSPESIGSSEEQVDIKSFERWQAQTQEYRTRVNQEVPLNRDPFTP